MLEAYGSGGAGGYKNKPQIPKASKSINFSLLFAKKQTGQEARLPGSLSYMWPIELWYTYNLQTLYYCEKNEYKISYTSDKTGSRTSHQLPTFTMGERHIEVEAWAGRVDSSPLATKTIPSD